MTHNAKTKIVPAIWFIVTLLLTFSPYNFVTVPIWTVAAIVVDYACGGFKGSTPFYDKEQCHARTTKQSDFDC